jgi:hypothetical protein
MALGQRNRGFNRTFLLNDDGQNWPEGIKERKRLKPICC